MNRVNHTCCSLKRVTVRKALSALFREEPCEQFAFDLGESLSKTSDLLNKIQIFCIFCPRVNCSCRSLLFHSFLKSNGSKLLWSLFTNEWWERVIPVTLYKRATVRDSYQALFHSQKTNDSHEKPKSKFPTLVQTNSAWSWTLRRLTLHWVSKLNFRKSKSGKHCT